ncbi:MAG: DUF697 domain-containing protein [Actinobacteria bacterium]|nr:MAG: DUF697 domain-containing protein [Actinomycetota bacterium]
MALPVKIRKIYKTLKDFEKQRSIITDIAVVGSKGAGKSALIKSLGPAKGIFTEITVLERPADYDLVLVVVSADKKLKIDEIKLVTKKLKKSDTSYLLVINKIDKAKDIEGLLDCLEDANVAMSNIVSVSATLNMGLDDLKKKILDNLVAHRLALASKAPSFRNLVVEKIIRATSSQNAIFAGVIIVPGADMPVLSANQVKMVLEIAAAYGEELSLERAKELLVTIGGGFLFRSAARQLLDFVPGPGWIIKASVAYGGTEALGRSAKLYFKKGISSLVKIGKK